MKIKLYLAIILLALLSCSTKEKVDKLAVLNPEELYQQGVKLVLKNQYKEAIDYFERIAQEYPYSNLAGKAQLMESYAYYKRAKFEEAIAGLEDYISLYAGEFNIDYAYYLKALCNYNQILDVDLDQYSTEKAKESFTEMINKFPDSKYSRDARFKLNLIYDHLAGKEMEVGRFYLKKNDTIAAINRFKTIVDLYQTTTHIEEALYRLVESYSILGLKNEANKYAAVLGNNYPSSKWYVYSYNLVK